MSDGSAARQDEESGEAADALERQFGHLDASAAGSLNASAIDANASWADLVEQDYAEVDGPLFGASDRQDERSPVPAGAAARAPALRPVARVVTHSRQPRAMSAPFSGGEVGAARTRAAEATQIGGPCRKLAVAQMQAVACMQAADDLATIFLKQGYTARPIVQATFLLRPRDANASTELERHFNMVIEVLSAFGLLAPVHEARAAVCVTNTFSADALVLWTDILDIERGDGSLPAAVGADSYVWRATKAMLALYVAPRQAQEFRATLPRLLRIKGPMADVEHAWKTTFRLGVKVAADTADRHGAYKYATPTWEEWFAQYMVPQLPPWATTLTHQKDTAKEFDEMGTAFALLIAMEPHHGARSLHVVSGGVADGERSDMTHADEPYLAYYDAYSGEPLDAASSVFALASNGRPFTCWRCHTPGHRHNQCMAEKSQQEIDRKPMTEWPPMPCHPSQAGARAPPRPAAAPVPYQRPMYPRAAGGDAFVTSVQAMPSPTMPLPMAAEDRLGALESTQAQILAQLANVLAVVTSPPPPSIHALPTLPVVEDGLYTLPPVRMGVASPSPEYVEMPPAAASSIWVRRDLAAASMTDEAFAANLAGARSENE